MLKTSQINDVVEHAKRIGATEEAIRVSLKGLGCTRVEFRGDSVIAYYPNPIGKDFFVECSPHEFSS